MKQQATSAAQAGIRHERQRFVKLWRGRRPRRGGIGRFPLPSSPSPAASPKMGPVVCSGSVRRSGQAANEQETGGARVPSTAIYRPLVCRGNQPDGATGRTGPACRPIP